MTTLRISELARAAGMTTDAVRYYEEIGLLRAPDRTPAGYRMYDDEAIERLRFIRGAQRIGLRLREIAELLEVMDRGQCPCGHTDTCCAAGSLSLTANWRTSPPCGPSSCDLSKITRRARALTARASGGVEPSLQTGGEENGTVPQLRLPVWRAALSMLRRGMNRSPDSSRV